MKKIFSTLSKMQLALLAMIMLGVAVSCSDDNLNSNLDSEITPEDLAAMEAADRFAAANSVIRALANLSELPDNWETSIFAPEEGIAIDEANPDIRNIISTDYDYARSYFLSIVPDLGLNGNTWSYAGIGTLTLRKVDDPNCYAVIDVNIQQMPGLKELRFVPEEVVGDNAPPAKTYYHAGDVVKDDRGVYWICVRPAGGKEKKRKAYFVTFDKSVITTATVKETIYNVDYNGKPTKEVNKNASGKWTYAKNLVEERFAYAAAHTFSMLLNAREFSAIGVKKSETFIEKADFIKNQCYYDISRKVAQAATKKAGYTTFYVAYGSYQKNDPKNKNIHQGSYFQPIVRFTLKPTGEFMRQNIKKTWSEPLDPNTPSKILMSLTAGHDPLAYKTFAEQEMIVSDDDDDNQIWFSEPNWKTFDVQKYFTENVGITEFGVPGGLMPSEYKFLDSDQVLVMAQTYINDSGNPYSGFKKVVEYNGVEPDYWGSIRYTVRNIFEYNAQEEEFVKE